MTNEEKEKVIRPPMEDIASGRVFRPHPRFKYKMWVAIFMLPVVLFIFGLVMWLPISYLVILDEGLGFIGYQLYLQQWLWPVLFWYWIINFIWMIPASILVPAYYNTFRYSVISEKGETMPEVFTRRGLITTTERHVPFRTITNISSTAGVLDKLLGIGSVEIETAGSSVRSSGQPGPEEKIEGIVFYEELRDFILRELRKFRAPYATGTEVVMPEEEPVPSLDDSLQDDILRTLRDMRDLLSSIDSKLIEGEKKKNE